MLEIMQESDLFDIFPESVVHILAVLSAQYIVFSRKIIQCRGGSRISKGGGGGGWQTIFIEGC